MPSLFPALLRVTAGLAALFAAALLAGCDSPVRPMPTLVSFRSGGIDRFEAVGSRLHGTEVPVLYATNRGAVNEKRDPVYAILPSDRLRMGSARAAPCGPQPAGAPILHDV